MTRFGAIEEKGTRGLEQAPSLRMNRQTPMAIL